MVLKNWRQFFIYIVHKSHSIPSWHFRGCMKQNLQLKRKQTCCLMPNSFTFTMNSACSPSLNHRRSDINTVNLLSCADESDGGVHAEVICVCFWKAGSDDRILCQGNVTGPWGSLHSAPHGARYGCCSPKFGAWVGGQAGRELRCRAPGASSQSASARVARDGLTHIRCIKD